MFQVRECFIAEKFHEDARGSLAFDWLDGTRPQALLIIKDLDQAEQDFEKNKQLKVSLLASRTIACGVGRGALLLGRVHSIPDLPLILHPITLSVKLQPSTLTACPDLTVFATELMHWPEFHNGVAQALETPDSSKAQGSRGWILQHHGLVEQAKSRRNPHESPELMVDRLSGLIFGLGLLGQLKVLRADDIYRFIRLNSEVVTVSTLLGLALSKHSLAAKTCWMHAFSPDQDVEVSGVIQAASLLGVGFAGLGTNERLTAELLLGLIGKRPIAGDRVLVNESETYNMAAGLGLGLITLGRAEELPSDLELKSRLLSLSGASDTDPSKLLSLAASHLHQRSLGDPATRSNLVAEGNKPNISLTSPAALLALGFGWWGTEDVTILEALSGPKTLTELENSPRPEVAFFRRLAYCLVAWNSLELSSWLEVPELKASQDADWLLITQTNAYIKAAGALALGLKFAGTSNTQVKQILWEHAKRLMIESGCFPPSQLARMASRPPVDVGLDRYTLDTVGVAAALALSVLCAGTGDLEVLRLLRAFRNRADEQTSFGTHQGVAQAIGFLFLGGGRKTFESSNIEKLAPLLISVLPRYCSGAGDQRFALHATRHFYVLATKPRQEDKENRGPGENNVDLMNELTSLLIKSRLN